MDQVIIGVDLGYGDSGKGSMVDALCRHKDTEMVVRYSGGPQATHNVITSNNEHHTFSQFGSGTFVPNVKTYLGPQMLVEPQALLVEADFLLRNKITDAFNRLYIDKRAPIITEFNIAINQTREHLRNELRHGSCGRGIYETRRDSRTYGDELLTAADLMDVSKAKEKLLLLRERKLKVLFDEFPMLFGKKIHPSAQAVHRLFTDDDFIEQTLEIYGRFAKLVKLGEPQMINDALATGKQVIFEPAQGMLIDEAAGFLPYVTGSDVSTHGAHKLLKEANYTGTPYTLGIVRGYMTRHGAGPLMTEDQSIAQKITERHNSSQHPWQGQFRFGWFDPVAVRYAIQATGGIDGLAVTCLDQVATLPEFKFATNYENEAHSVVKEIPSQMNMNESERIALTNEISSWVPRYKSCESNEDAVLKAIEDSCNTHIVATSGGITAQHKKFNLPS